MPEREVIKVQKVPFRISLIAARVNVGMKQQDVANYLSEYFGTRVSRQRISNYEKRPETIPPAYGEAFSKLYKIPIDYISFEREST